MATFQDVIDIARGIYNDTDSTGYRVSDDESLRYANDSLDAIALIRPSLFYATTEIDCVSGVIQQLPSSGSLGLVDIWQVKNGNVVTKADKAALDRIKPAWMSDTAAAAKHWMPMGDDPYRFFVWPPASNTQVLVGTHIATPSEYDITDDIPIAASYAPVMAQYVVGMAEMRDDEYAVAGRAAAAMSAFFQMLGVSGKTSPAGVKTPKPKESN